MQVDIKGDAWTIKPNVSRHALTEGDVVLFDYGGRGKDHGALILGFEGEQHLGTVTAPEFLIIIEANYTRCKVGMRKVAWDDPSIKGGYRNPQAVPTNSSYVR